MYTKDIRSRISTYDRMRVDQQKLTDLSNKARDMKNKLKQMDHTWEPHNRLELKASSPIRSRSKSPTKLILNLDQIDAHNYK